MDKFSVMIDELKVTEITRFKLCLSFKHLEVQEPCEYLNLFPINLFFRQNIKYNTEALHHTQTIAPHDSRVQVRAAESEAMFC